MPNVALPNARVRSAAAGLGLILVLGVAAPSAPVRAGDPPRQPSPPPGLRTFMEALAAVESGGRYDAVNRSSGAYGRYQVMPSNWPAWAGRYLGNRNAKPTPKNQDKVVAGRLSDLYSGRGHWGRVAYWWLTGKSGPRSGWSRFATRYVDKVVTGYRLRLATPAAGGTRVLGDRSDAIRWSTGWHDARSPHYTGGHARSTKRAGASATMWVRGKSVRIEGPVGPTRGRVAIYLDGRFVRTVSLHARTFRPRTVLYSATWRTRRVHKLELRVLKAPRGRTTVAVDRVVVRG